MNKKKDPTLNGADLGTGVGQAKGKGAGYDQNGRSIYRNRFTVDY